MSIWMLKKCLKDKYLTPTNFYLAPSAAPDLALKDIKFIRELLKAYRKYIYETDQFGLASNAAPDLALNRLYFV